MEESVFVFFAFCCGHPGFAAGRSQSQSVAVIFFRVRCPTRPGNLRKHLKMNGLQYKQHTGGSNPVKVNQTSSRDAKL
jgi:hypothetical protein